MRLLICSQVSIPAIQRYIPDWSQLNHQVDFMQMSGHPDAIIGMGIGAIKQIQEAIKEYPDVPLFIYHWDCYSWIWTRPRPGEYDYKVWGRLLCLADEVWVPSKCTGVQATEWWGIENWVTILSSVPTWEHDNIRDDGYVLCTLRHLPDECDAWFERACEELGLPYRRPDHELSYDAYKDMVAGCRLLVSHYKEASTGGLSLLEGYYHGKPVLLTTSVWNGANEYFGGRAWHFNPDLGYENFKERLSQLYELPCLMDSDYREWVAKNFSDTRMLDQMMERINANLV